jgi:hypothetical protein
MLVDIVDDPALTSEMLASGLMAGMVPHCKVTL